MRLVQGAFYSILAAALDQGTAVTAYDTKFVMIHVL